MVFFGLEFGLGFVIVLAVLSVLDLVGGLDVLFVLVVLWRGAVWQWGGKMRLFGGGVGILVGVEFGVVRDLLAVVMRVALDALMCLVVDVDVGGDVLVWLECKLGHEGGEGEGIAAGGERGAQ